MIIEHSSQASRHKRRGSSSAKSDWTDFRFGVHSGRKSDNTALPKSANSQHWHRQLGDT
jgi:hypothetical protein